MLLKVKLSIIIKIQQLYCYQKTNATWTLVAITIHVRRKNLFCELNKSIKLEINFEDNIVRPVFVRKNPY